jgi:quercetin dioxygenase-like cupin family protein
MKISRPIFGLALLMSATLLAQDAQVTPLMSKDLADFPGKEGLMITVVYPPGASDPIHRHNAHAFVYVLEGSIVMQLNGGKEVTLTPGQTFYEGPNDIHTVGRNASATKPAKFIVVLLKDKAAPVVLPVTPKSACVCISPNLNSLAASPQTSGRASGPERQRIALQRAW